MDLPRVREFAPQCRFKPSAAIRARWFWLPQVCILAAFSPATGYAQTQAAAVVLRAFSFEPGGYAPVSGVIRDAEGNLYGTAYGRGRYGNGAVYKMSPAGIEIVIYSFSGGADGGNPQYPLAADSHGNLYGTTLNGGAGIGGVVFKIDATGHETVVYNLNGNSVSGGLVLDAAGNIYGVTDIEVFKIDTGGNFSVLYSFDQREYGVDGGPLAGLILDAAGNLYGTTPFGGSWRQGTVFRLSPSGQETVLHSFGGPGDGCQPSAPLTFDAASGYLYGTTSGCGASNLGTIFKIDSSGHETVVHSFTGPDGANPGSAGISSAGTALAVDALGNLYGAAQHGGGGSGQGVLFRMDPSGQLTVLHAFTGRADGGAPSGSLALDAEGNVYGTAASGGPTGAGVSGLGIVYRCNASTQKLTVLGLWGALYGTGPLDLLPDGKGNTYGVTQWGGLLDQGVIFKLDAAGNEKVLHTFTGGVDGGYPSFMLLGASDTLYGTATQGGAYGQGAVFRLDAATGGYKILHSFTRGAGGNYPVSLVLDPAGNLYGAAGGGQYGAGLVFKLDSTGNYSVLYAFTGGADGANPGTLLRDPAGNLYGMTSNVGPYLCNSSGTGCATVFKLDTAGRETVLYAFTGGAGGGCPSTLTADSAGNLYGAAGCQFEGGYEAKQFGSPASAPTGNSVFELTKSGEFKVLCDLPAVGLPWGNLVLDAAGNIYGATATQDPNANGGSVYELTPAGVFTVLYSFPAIVHNVNATGSTPNSLLRDSAGNLYGTTQSGGPYGGGAIFKITPP